MEYLLVGLEVISILKGEGYSSFIVGGAVRDLLLDMPIHDIDIATSATPSVIGTIFEVKESGIKYNSVTIVYKGYQFEATTFRKEIAYLDNRHPDYVLAQTLEEDVIRRDFTINALALDKDNNLIDLVNGLDDIKNKIIRTIGNPDTRFKEDALRILRAIYFYAKLDFEIDGMTKIALKENAFLVQGLSFDRIKNELDKMVETGNYLAAFRLMDELKITPYLKELSRGVNLIYKQNILDANPFLLLLLSYYKSDNLPQIKEKKRMENVYRLLDQDLLDPTVLFDNIFDDILYANRLLVIFKTRPYDSTTLYKSYESLPIHSLYELDINARDIMNELHLANEDVGKALNIAVKGVLYKKVSNKRDELFKYILKLFK